MSAIPGIRFDITGASGSQGLLSPKSGWKCYVLPRGGYASQDSAGTTITFDSAAIAGRFGAGIWIQAGLLAANIRQVAAVGGNSLTVSGAALTITENMRVYIIGSTEPTISGGSVTYSTPSTTIRQRDDDGADLYTNSMVTTNADGLVQFFSDPAVYDCLIQDGNQSLQGSIIDVPVGVAEGISTSYATVFGATVTINAALGVTGWATFGQTATFNAALGVTGWATFGATVTMNANAGVTGTFAVGATSTFTGNASFGNSLSVSGALTVTGRGTIGQTLTTAGITNVGDVSTTHDLFYRRMYPTRGTTLTAAGFSLTAGWGSTATVSLASRCTDTAGYFFVAPGGAGITADPSVIINFVDGAFANGCIVLLTRIDGNSGTVGYWNGPVSVVAGMTQAQLRFVSGIPNGALIAAQYLVIGL